MNVNAQKFQSQYELVHKPLARSNHRTTLPQSRPFGRDSSLREGAGNGLFPFNRVLAKPEGYGRFSSPLRRAGSTHRGVAGSEGDGILGQLMPGEVGDKLLGGGGGVLVDEAGGEGQVAGDFRRGFALSQLP